MKFDCVANDCGMFSVSTKDRKGRKSSNFAAQWGNEAAPVSNLQSKKSKSWNNFKSKVYATSKPAFQPRKNRESCEDYTQVFLCHARLYVFADKYDIDPLRALSVHKLQLSRSDITSDGCHFCFDVYFAVIAFSNYFLCSWMAAA